MLCFDPQDLRKWPNIEVSLIQAQEKGLQAYNTLFCCSIYITSLARWSLSEIIQGLKNSPKSNLAPTHCVVYFW